MVKNHFRAYFLLHLVIILLIWISPFYLNWKIILFLIFLYYIQLLIFGNCVINIIQFSTRFREPSFYAFVLERLGFKINRKRIILLADFVFPWIILGISLIWQLILK